jgi:protein-tyrosine phosphatase
VLDIPNFRDIGGFFSSKYNCETKKGIIFRSPSLQLASINDLTLLINNKITNIIDLRSKYEIEKEGVGYLNNNKFLNKFSYNNIPLLTTDKWKVDPVGTKEGYLDQGLYYYKYIEDNNEIIKVIFDIIINSINNEQGVIFHCAFGKDRTGVISALLQDLLGLERKILASEFSKSSQYIDKLVEFYKSSNTYSRDLNLLDKKYIQSREVSILDFLSIIDNKYGSVYNYLKFIYNETNDIDIILNNLLIKS